VALTEGIAVGRDCVCYQVTSPPAVVNGLVVVGSSIGDRRAVEVERGVVRAYDARTGALRWSWDPIPTRASDPAAATWAGESWRRNGAANVWSSRAGGGLVFIAAARDTALRAFDVEMGNLLWTAELPASAQATPMTYRSASGKQFVVIAAGGHAVMGTKRGDHVVAFTLP